MRRDRFSLWLYVLRRLVLGRNLGMGLHPTYVSLVQGYRLAGLQFQVQS